MGSIRFTPTFHHVDWLDSTDRVRAGEPNGFNARFHAIESDLGQLSTVVAQIDTALDQRGQPPSQLHLDTPPTLGITGADAWNITEDGGAFVTVGRGATGVMNLTVPHGVVLVSLRVVGAASGATATIALQRLTVNGSTTPDVLATVTGDANPFDKTADIDPAVGPTIPGTFRYLIRATAGTVPTNGVMRLDAFQLAYRGA